LAAASAAGAECTVAAVGANVAAGAAVSLL
jgi:hypothetical protein